MINPIPGYPADARLLILNADDLGMCHATNAAIFAALAAGPIRSTTLMAPCPWAAHALAHLTAHPEIPFGIHLTAIGDSPAYPWRPLTPPGRIPGLVDGRGCFHTSDAAPDFLARVRLEELELEFRAQIEAVLATGLRPTHLDWHALRISARADIFDLLLRLARAYGLALRVYGRANIERIQGLGLPCADYDFLDSYLLDPASKPARFAQLLHELPAGLSEWAIHPGLITPELQAIEGEGSQYRQADYDFWTSPQAREIVAREGIILLDYRVLQELWRQV